MDLNDSSNESSEFSQSITAEKNTDTSVGCMSPTSEKKCVEMDFIHLGNSNDHHTDSNSDCSFHSIDDPDEDNVDSKNNEHDKKGNEMHETSSYTNVKSDTNLSINSAYTIESSDLICGGVNENIAIEDDSNLCDGFEKLEKHSNTASEREIINSSIKEKSAYENTVTNIVSDENAVFGVTIEDNVVHEELLQTDSPVNLPCNVTENYFGGEYEVRGSNENNIEESLSDNSYAIQMQEDSQTSIVDEADESFSLDEVLEESEGSEKDQTKEDSTSEDHLVFDEDSVTSSIAADSSESLNHERDCEQSTTGKYQIHNSLSINESVVSTSDVTAVERVNCERNHDDPNSDQSESIENSSEAKAVDSITIEISPKKSYEILSNSTNNHQSDSRNDFTKVSKDKVPSSHENPVPTEESTDSEVSDLKNERQFPVASKIIDRLTDPEDNICHSDSAQESLREVARRTSLRHVNHSEDSHQAVNNSNLSDVSTPTTNETINKANLRTRSNLKSKIPRYGPNWTPQIKNVVGATNEFSISLHKVNSNSSSNVDVKKEKIDTPYRLDSVNKEKFNLIDFSIKLDKMDIDSDVEIISVSPPRCRVALSRSLGNDTNSRTLSRSEMLRNRLRSRTASNRWRRNDRPISRPSATRRSPRSSSKSVSSINEQLVKNRTSGDEHENRSDVAAKSPAKISTRSDEENRRNLRSAGFILEHEVVNRNDFLRSLNLRSRKESDEEKMKGILVKPKNNKIPSKRVSFQLPNESTSKGQNNSSKRRDSLAKRTTRRSTRRVNGKRKINSKQPNRNTGSVSKKSKSSSSLPKEVSEEREEEIVDENPLEKFESLVDVCKKTVDLWYECECCNQKYFLIDNAKQHVRTHFPNCLTN